MSFATDFASSYATSVATTLGLDNTTVKVSCLYREADVLKIDLLTLSGSCGGAGADRRLARRLQDSGFGIEVTRAVWVELFSFFSFGGAPNKEKLPNLIIPRSRPNY